jgi:hypothetical protein
MSVHCEYSLLEGDIHEFVFREGNRQAVDDWISQTEAILRATQADRFYQLVDSSNVSDVPLSYAYQRIKTLSPQYEFVRYWRVAFLHSHSTLVFLVNTYINMLRRLIKARFFVPEEREAAIAWLREERYAGQQAIS